jgi:hypothetical protein
MAMSVRDIEAGKFVACESELIKTNTLSEHNAAIGIVPVVLSDSSERQMNWPTLHLSRNYRE